MTQKQIDYLISVHQSQMNFAKKYLDQYYYDLEDDDKEEEWLKRYIFHKRAIEQLKHEKPEQD